MAMSTEHTIVIGGERQEAPFELILKWGAMQDRMVVTLLVLMGRSLGLPAARVQELTPFCHPGSSQISILHPLHPIDMYL